jgi:hypothetical protein
VIGEAIATRHLRIELCYPKREPDGTLDQGTLRSGWAAADMFDQLSANRFEKATFTATAVDSR